MEHGLSLQWARQRAGGSRGKGPEVGPAWCGVRDSAAPAGLTAEDTAEGPRREVCQGGPSVEGIESQPRV